MLNLQRGDDVVFVSKNEVPLQDTLLLLLYPDGQPLQAL
jgi:hypothetical protein